MTDILLLGILIMLIIMFHNNASSGGRYMKLYDLLMHRCPKYMKCKVISKNKVYWFIYKWTIIIKEYRR